MPKPLPKLQRVAAYALILRDDRILLTRLASRISADEKWHLPGGGVDHGENPRDALVREIREETGLDGRGRRHRPRLLRPPALDVAQGPALGLPGPAHRVRRVGAHRRARAARGRGGRLDRGRRLAPRRRRAVRRPRGHRHRHRVAGRPPAVPAPAGGGLRLGTPRPRRPADADLASRLPIPARGPSPAAGSTTARRPATRWRARCARSAAWSARSATCSTSTTPTSRAPRPPVGSRTSTACISSSGARSPTTAEARVVETDGTTDAVAWVPVADIESGAVRTLDVVRAALAADKPP